MARRPNGRSSVFEGSDGYWHGYVTVGFKPDGKPDRRHVQGPTEAAATKKVRKLERDRERGEVRKTGKARTVTGWLTTYLDTIAPQKVVPRTLDAYWSLATHWIIPTIGHVRLDRLTPEHVDQLHPRCSPLGAPHRWSSRHTGSSPGRSRSPTGADT